MKLTTKPTTMLLIEDLMQPPHRLDPIRVITENFEPGKGRIIITCYDAAWVGYWGAMGGKTVEQFFTSCDADYLAGNMGCARSLSQSNGNRAYLVRVIRAVQDALIKRQPKITPARQARLDRVGHANELIRVISDHGRRFFWNERDKRIARLELDQRGKVWWVDDYRGTRVCIEKFGWYEHRWQGFSHGGTLKSLVQAMRDYIKTGDRIPLGYIGMDCWGYDEAAAATIEAARGLPIILNLGSAR